LSTQAVNEEAARLVVDLEKELSETAAANGRAAENEALVGNACERATGRQPMTPNDRVQRRAGRRATRAACVRTPTKETKPASGASAATPGWATAHETLPTQQNREGPWGGEDGL
jgi:hypothetical protein